MNAAMTVLTVINYAAAGVALVGLTAAVIVFARWAFQPIPPEPVETVWTRDNSTLRRPGRR